MIFGMLQGHQNATELRKFLPLWFNKRGICIKDMLYGKYDWENKLYGLFGKDVTLFLL